MTKLQFHNQRGYKWRWKLYSLYIWRDDKRRFADTILDLTDLYVTFTTAVGNTENRDRYEGKFNIFSCVLSSKSHLGCLDKATSNPLFPLLWQTVFYVIQVLRPKKQFLIEHTYYVTWEKVFNVRYKFNWKKYWISNVDHNTAQLDGSNPIHSVNAWCSKKWESERAIKSHPR